MTIRCLSFLTQILGQPANPGFAYSRQRCIDDALLRPESRDAFARLLTRGWIDGLRKMHPEERIYTLWDYCRNYFQRDHGPRIETFSAQSLPYREGTFREKLFGRGKITPARPTSWRTVPAAVGRSAQRARA